MSERFPAPIAAVLLLLYITGTLFVALNHEPWRDEADAWLAARDLPLTEMVPNWTAHAGTPVVWYLILKTIVHSRLPYVAETMVNLIFAWAAAGLLLFRAPIPRFTKIAFLASYFMAYEYAVIARSYALAILLIFLAATLRERALPYAIAVAILFNVSVHGAIFAAAFLLIAYRSRYVLVMIGGALLSLWQLWPRDGGNSLAGHGARNGAITALRDVFVPSSTTAWTALLSVAVLILIAIAIRQSKQALIFLCATVIALLALYGVVWFGGLRASGLILIAAITSMWLAGSVSLRPAAIALNITLLISAWFTLSIARADIKYAFSGSKEMAEFIDHRLDNQEIAAHNMYSAEALLPYLPHRKFFYLGLGESGTYLKWDEAMRRGAMMPYPTAVAIAKQRGSMLLLNAKMPQPETYGFRLIHATPVIVFRNLDERYWLYAPVQNSTNVPPPAPSTLR